MLMLRKMIPFVTFSMDVPAPIFSSSLVGRLCPFPQSHKIRQGAKNLPLLFFFFSPKVVPWSVQGQVHSSNLAELNWLPISMCFLCGFLLTFCRAHTHYVWRLVHNECGSMHVLSQGTYRMLRARVNQLWGPAGKVSNGVHGSASSW